MHNKKGTIGMTMTWAVGTLIVFFVLLLFILAVSALAKAKEISDLKIPGIIENEKSYAEKKSCSAYILSEKKPCSDEFEILKNKMGVT